MFVRISNESRGGVAYGKGFNCVGDGEFCTVARSDRGDKAGPYLFMPTVPLAADRIDPPPSGFTPRLLAEAVRLHEDALGGPLHEPRADELGRATAGDLERRIVVRAQALSVAPALQSALAHLRTGTQVVFAAALVGALLAGAGAARLVLGSYAEGPVNFFLALTSLLGLHTLMLLVWLVVVVFHPGSGAISLLGGLVLRLGRRVTRWLHDGPLELAALRAAGEVLASPQFGRWALSTISHSLWLAYLAGCLGIVLLLLGTRQYDFAWETTILSERAYVAVARAISAPVEALGFAVPDPEQVAGSRRTGSGQVFAGRDRWGGLLVGCLVVYGVLPRSLALLVSLGALFRARSRYKLDTSRPGFARLEGRLVAFARPVGVVDPDEPAPAVEDAAVARPATRITGNGPVGILGLEVEPPPSGWPPSIAGIDWWDLGFAENRADRHCVLEKARAADAKAKAVVVVCSLAATPDRGTGAFLANLAQINPRPVVLLMTHGQRLRERSPLAEVEERINDWRKLATQAGIAAGAVLDLDLDNLTADSRRRLAHLLNPGDVVARPHSRHLDRAFDLIVEHASGWKGEPDAASRAELHRAIARLWEAEGGAGSWRNLLRIRPLDLARPALGLKSAAERMVALLPVRLRLDPRWLAAGAAGGALACIAAAGLVAPVAIASLPVWAGVGAALTALLPRRGVQEEDDKIQSAPDLAPSVDAAALFAMLLELQGLDETTISRVLDAAVGDGTDDRPLADAAAVRTHLNDLRVRFEAALAAEGG